eukprot:Gb_36921 [translate_table: standard]
MASNCEVMHLESLDNCFVKDWSEMTSVTLVAKRPATMLIVCVTKTFMIAKTMTIERLPTTNDIMKTTRRNHFGRCTGADRQKYITWSFFTLAPSGAKLFLQELVVVVAGNPDRPVDGINTIGMLLTSTKADTEAGNLGIPTEDEGRDPYYFSLLVSERDKGLGVGECWTT